jgi:TRAP-type uncharacterized transport system substrate-binding protein
MSKTSRETHKKVKKVKSFEYLRTIVADEARAIYELARDQKYLAAGILFLVISLIFYLNNLSSGEINIVADKQGSSWYQIADAISKSSVDTGFKIATTESQGAIQNSELLSEKNNKINAALLIPGALDREILDQFYSLGNIDYEPIWIFYNKKIGNISSLEDLAKYRVGVGPLKSGRFKLTKRIFDLNNINIADNERFSQGDVPTQIENFNNSKLDALIFIGVPNSDNVKKLAQNPNAVLYSFDDADAYVQNIPSLEKLILKKSSLDISNKTPRSDVTLLAISTVLAVKKDMTPNMQWALLLSAKKSLDNDEVVFFGKSGQFPANLSNAIHLSPVATQFYEKGPPILYGKTPFWFAILVDRFWVILLTAIAIIYPLSKLNLHLRAYHFSLSERSTFIELIDMSKRINLSDIGIDELITMQNRLEEIIIHSSHHHVPVSEESQYFEMFRNIEAVSKRINQRLSELKE